jgi:hypothetical protein
VRPENVVAVTRGQAPKHDESVAPAHPSMCVDATAQLRPRTSVSSYKESYFLSYNISPNRAPGPVGSSRGTDGLSGQGLPEREVRTAVLRRQQQRRYASFLKGPILVSVIAAAGALPGRALLVLLAIRYRIDLTGRPQVTLPASVMREFGFDRFTKRRALAELENAGLVRVQSARGRSMTVELATQRAAPIARAGGGAI